MNTYPCTLCGTTESPGSWWRLQGYYGLYGRFCSSCYEAVSHDRYGKPNHPEKFALARVKLVVIPRMTK